MKNVLTILSVFLVSQSIVTAQNHKLNIGIEGGPSLSSVYGFEQTLIEVTSKPSYSIALSLKYNISSNFSIVTGIGFENKGNQSKEKLGFTDSKGNIIGYYQIRNTYNYINIPLMARYTLGKNNWRLFVNLGGYFGVMINAKSELVGYNYSDTVDGDISEYYQPIDFGLAGGVGLAYSFSSRLALSLEVRNNLGLYNISDRAIINDGANKLNSTNLLIGFSFGIGKS